MIFQKHSQIKTLFLALFLVACTFSSTANNPCLETSTIPYSGDCPNENKEDFFMNESSVILSLENIKDHISGTNTLSASQLVAEQSNIETNASLFETSTEIIALAFEVVSSHDATYGALFTSGTTTLGGIVPRTASGYELEKAILVIMQAILDYGYTENNIKAYPALFNNVKFDTSDFFPGAVTPPANENVSYTVRINGKHVRSSGTPVNYETEDARRPTGCYLAPGSIAQVTVPSSLVNIGASILVGAHTWNHAIRPNIKRMDRVTKKYEINSETVTVGNPLGGGIYINIPFEKDLGILNVTLKNVVRSPYYANTVANKTTLAEWQNEQRGLDAPWTDFESDKVMMQVPTSWIYALNDPSTMMDDWDKSMDAISEMQAKPLIRSKTVVYSQVDVQMRGHANFPGYPQANVTYNPYANYNGNHNNYLVNGPRNERGYLATTFFHELGHAEKIYKFTGEIEAFVNFLWVAVYNKAFGVDLDKAFSESFWTMEHTIDEAAISWMIAENFRLGNRMSITTGQYRQEFSYQHRGYAKYADIVRLFGWEAIENYYALVNENYENGVYDYSSNVNSVPTDDRIYEMSKAAGYDLRPLLHFWGIHPLNFNNLANSIEESGIKKSTAIYDQLMYYKTIVPMSNSAFRAFGLEDFSESNILNYNTLYNHTSQSYYQGFLQNWWNDYDEEEGQAAVEEVQNIIDLYFPDGRPQEGFMPDPDKTYYIDVPVHNLRLAATGESEDAYTTSISTTGADVAWKFVAKGNGSWHLQRAAGGSKPRLRTDNTQYADMQPTTWSGVWTYYDITEGATAGTYFLTIPNGPANFKRLQVDNTGTVKMVENTRNGTWESFKITEVSDSSTACTPEINLALNGSIVAFSAEQNSTNTVTNIIDGNDGNRWSALGFPQYAVIDLGADYNVNEIRLSTYFNRDYQFTVEGSTTSPSSGYTTLVNASNNTSPGPISLSFATQTVRYVRLTVTGANSYTGSWSSITDFDIICAGNSESKNIASTYQVAIYPNPLSYGDQLHIIASDISSSKVEILNLAGQQVDVGYIKEGKGLLHLDSLMNGIYFVKIVGEDRSYFKKISIQK